MKHFSQDIINNVNLFNEKVKLASVENEDIVQEKMHLSFLVSELPEDERKKLIQNKENIEDVLE